MASETASSDAGGHGADPLERPVSSRIYRAGLVARRGSAPRGRVHVGRPEPLPEPRLAAVVRPGDAPSSSPASSPAVIPDRMPGLDRGSRGATLGDERLADYSA